MESRLAKVGLRLLLLLLLRAGLRRSWRFDLHGAGAESWNCDRFAGRNRTELVRVDLDGLPSGRKAEAAQTRMLGVGNRRRRLQLRLGRTSMNVGAAEQILQRNVRPLETARSTQIRSARK